MENPLQKSKSEETLLARDERRVRRQYQRH